MIGVPDAIRRRHARKLGLAALLVVVAVAAVGGWLLVETNEAVHGHAEQELQSTAQVQAREVATWTDQVREEARLLSRADPVASDDPAEVRSFLREEVSDDRARLPEEVVAIHYVDTAAPEIVTSTDDAFVGVDPRAQGVPWAQRDLSFASSEATLITRPFEAPNVDSPVIAVISPVPDRPDRVLVLMVSLEARSASMPRPSGESSFTVVVDDRGTNVLAHDPSIVGQQHVGEAGVASTSVRRGLEGQVGYRTMTVDGTKTAVGYAPVEGTDWVVITHVPASEAFALRDLVTRSLGAIVGIALLGLGAIVVVIGRPTASALDDLAGRAERLEDGDLDVELESDRVDEIGRLYEAFDEMRDSLVDRIEEAERARERTEQMNEHLTETAREYGDVMRAAGRGDLSVRIEPDERSEAMATVAEEFNHMIEGIEATTAAVQAFAGEVADASQAATASTEEVRTAGERMSTSIQEISEGAETQNERFQVVSRETDELSETIQEIAAAAEEVADLAEQTAAAGREGQDSADRSRELMNEVADGARDSVAEVEQLREALAEVETLVEVIADVADDTNMIALNANIEASRAGDGDGTGDGFGAVAEQVRELADQTKRHAADAEEVLDRIREHAATTERQVRSTADGAVESADAVAETAAALDRIVDYADETAAEAEDVSAATTRQSASVQEVLSSVEAAATVSDETAAATQTVAAAAQEQTATLREVDRSVGDLADRADGLASTLDRFRTRGSDAIDADAAVDLAETVDAADGTDAADGVDEGGTTGADD